MAFKQKPLNREEFSMVIIEDLGQFRPEGLSRSTRHAIFECNHCLKQFTARATGTVARAQTSCKLCTLSENKEYTHPLYAIWNGIRQRCYNPKRKDYSRYGAKGVTMHKEWKENFISFYEWCILNGWKENLVIDKDIKSRELGISPATYSPTTISFITQSANAREASGKKIDQLTLQGEIITTFNSAIEAGLFVGLVSGDPITNCCRGRTKSSAGYKWQYNKC